jgi:hypothetical protein
MKRIVLTSVCLLTLASTLGPPTAEARPGYMKAFKELYLVRTPRVKAACAICHPSKSKDHRNRYGRALEEALGGKNVKDRERVREAMKSIEHLFPGLPKSD